MDRETYPNARVVDLASKLIPVKMDLDKPEPVKVATKYNVEITPTIAFIGPDGKALHTIIGFFPPDKFAAEMKTALQKGPQPAPQKGAPKKH